MTEPERTDPTPAPPDTRDETAVSRRTVQGVRRANLASIVATALIAVLVVVSVPVSTTVEYSRLSRGWDLPVVILAVVPLVLLPPYITTGKRGSQDLRARERKVFVLVACIYLALMVGAQVAMGWGFLRAGGIW
ncbi:hypothetical protein BIU98_03400 [Curtobacterium sp. MMLR14_010]|uniref:hypothetical protein n=1 Tax=Curtobacterium sp. MMLR14_010 TaxID=1898743 RepID=UPI0008DD3BA9|nr:hypothetical protein [Curtobacterium sp. MMLR14_010]OII35000.1 hypothetical protein BIU98_03400 [Curtobacterium sp. MMLR14_010]